jgi:molybdenum cofactor biosynthesis enzyme MoaA
MAKEYTSNYHAARVPHQMDRVNDSLHTTHLPEFNKITTATVP